MKATYLVMVACLLVFAGGCQSKSDAMTALEDREGIWVDSIYATMDLREKVGQLFFAATYSNRDRAHYDTIRNLVSQHHIGGLIFFQGGPVRQARLSNAYQEVSRVPLMIGIDGEWGMRMRLDSTFRYPYNMTLGAVQDSSLLRKVGERIGWHARQLGVHMNYAPVVDVNTNPANPVIGVRSFGEAPDRVGMQALAFMQGLQQSGVLACAKHFPGHGDTASDSHHTLPLVDKTKAQLDSIELWPYRTLISSDLAGVMVGHLDVPTLTDMPGRPSSLSDKVIQGLLQKELGFQGLVMTDALNMKGVANFSEPGEVDLLAFQAGNDMLLFSENIPKGIDKILTALNKGELSENRLESSVRKILSAKYRAGLGSYEPAKLDGLVNRLNQQEDSVLYQEVASQALTLVKKDPSAKPAEGEKYAYLGLGQANADHFRIMSQYLDLERVTPEEAEKGIQGRVLLIEYARANPRDVRAMTEDEATMIAELAARNKVVLTVYASQYVLRNLDLEQVETLLLAYENSPDFHHVAGAVLKGGSKARGRLPASLNQDFKAGHGL